MSAIDKTILITGGLGHIGSNLMKVILLKWIIMVMDLTFF